jgi:shikimate kinase
MEPGERDAETGMAADGRDTIRLARPLVLVGMMGAGKTSVGRRLARLLQVPFRDSDHEIEAAAGMSVSELFARYGEAAFRDGERRVVERLLSGDPVVVATGGGAFIEPATRDVIQRAATSVWLRADLATLWERVRGRPGRPLLDRPDPRATLAEIDARRRPIYAEADVVVDSPPGRSHDAMARSVITAVLAHDAGRDPAAATLRPAS